MAATVGMNPRLTNGLRECQDAVCGGCCPRLVGDARSIISAKAGIQGWWGSHRRAHLPTWDRFAVREQSIQSRFAGTSETSETCFRPAKKSLAARGRFAGTSRTSETCFRPAKKKFGRWRTFAGTSGTFETFFGRLKIKFSRQRTLPDTLIRGGNPLRAASRNCTSIVGDQVKRRSESPRSPRETAL